MQHQAITLTNDDIVDWILMNKDIVVFMIENAFENVGKNGYFDGLVQDASISSALAMEILQSCTKPLILSWPQYVDHTPHDRLGEQNSPLHEHS